MCVRIFSRLAPAWAWLCLATGLGGAHAADDLFRAQVAPVLERSCITCHNENVKKGGLALDTAKGLNAGGESGAVVEPGHPAESILIDYISGPKPQMPKKGPPLAQEEIKALRNWVAAGAKWPANLTLQEHHLANTQWWSLQPLVVKPPLPKLSPENAARVRTPIDAFILAKLAEKGLTLSPEADARTLCRRLYFDLTGLPPSPEELEAFVLSAQGNAEAAYTQLVENLLASPRYGERWARHWLDVVHYGDTYGYDKDKLRPNAWPYRDYVIRALNHDKPYAQFVQEQIAGDVLYPGTQDGITALGFIAAGPWDFIGHAEVPESKIDGKVARHLDRDDMVGNAVGALCSVTIQCAQCHNHKFDPFTQEDYYSLQAVFAALDRADKSYDLIPAVAQARATLAEKKAAAQTRRDLLAAKAATLAGEALAALDKKIAEFKKPNANLAASNGWHSALEPRANVEKWVQVNLGKPVALGQVVLHPCHDDFNGIGNGFGFPPRFKVEASNDAAFKLGVTLLANETAKDFPNPKITAVSYPATCSAQYVRITATQLAARMNDFMFALAELEVLDGAGMNLAAGAAVTSLDSIEAHPRWARANLTDRYYPGANLTNIAATAQDTSKLEQARRLILESMLGEKEAAEFAALENELANLETQMRALPAPGLVYAGTVHRGEGAFEGTGGKGGKPRPVFILTRGQVTSPQREVGPGALSAVAALPSRFEIGPQEPEGARRAALARWLTDAKNPLTWRSIVNRAWLYHFGRGLVETPNDFGHMGAAPSHLELLNWLAADFRDNGGSLKNLHRLLVTSAAYRQSSAVGNTQAAQLDTNNTLLWRQNRRKLEAEAMRDAVLAVSGKLDLGMGGPGWQDFVIEHPEHSPHFEYNLADPNDAKTWRRSVYRFIVRSQMQPFMTSLDCADPSMRVDKRNESVSPAQALALLNNGFMVTQAAHFAARAEREAGPALPAQVQRAFRLAFGHAPAAAEQEKLLAFAQARGLPNLCRVLLNLNEFAFVD